MNIDTFSAALLHDAPPSGWSRALQALWHQGKGDWIAPISSLRRRMTLKLKLTVVGDTVNIASRVEAYCRSLDAAVLVTGAFVDSLHAEGSDNLAERFADQGHHVLSGRAEPIHLYGVSRSANP